MGLIDRLADKVFDEATAARREQSQRRRALRDLAVNQLRSYSEAVERMRVALLQARSAVETAATQDPGINPDDLIAPSHPGHHLGDPIVSETLELGVHPDDADVIAGAFAERAWLNMIGPEAVEHHRRTRDGHLAVSAEFARQRAYELDAAWARVRPILDDALEIEAVVYLRQFATRSAA